MCSKAEIRELPHANSGASVGTGNCVLTTHGAASDDKACSMTTPPGIRWRGVINFTPVTSCTPYCKEIMQISIIYLIWSNMRNILFTDIISRGFRYIAVSLTRHRTQHWEEKAKTLVWLSSESVTNKRHPIPRPYERAMEHLTEFGMKDGRQMR